MNTAGVLSQNDMVEKRKKKDQNRREIKEARKNRVKEATKTAQLAKPKEEKKVEEVEYDLKTMSFPEKLTALKELADEILINPERNYQKMDDLFLFTEDAKHFDIVIMALKQLERVFMDIIPSYRIREDFEDEEKKSKQKLSKEVQNLRDYEINLIKSYKHYLQIIEKLAKLKPAHFAGRIEDPDKKKQMINVYSKMRNQSIESFCKLIKRHPHFNYRLNIIQTIFPRLSTQDKEIRAMVTDVLFVLLKHEDQTLLDFKIDVLKELNIVLKNKSHQHMQENLLECLVLHLIVVDEERAQAIT